jgi:imidazolonepropionase-like amidohydrolase
MHVGTLLALIADRLFDGAGDPPSTGLAVLVENGRVAAVESDRGLPPRAERREFAGGTILPGLIDAHVHLCMDPSPSPMALRDLDPARLAVQGVANARATLEGGVTTVRCVGTPGNVDLVLRDAIRSGTIQGPRVIGAGRTIAMTGGHGYPMAIEADGRDGVMAAVRTQVKAGADVIKLMVTGGVLTPGGIPGTPQMLPEEIAAAITVAHRAGRRVCGHAEGPEGVADAVEAGIDSIEHGYFLADDPLFPRMQANPTWLVPTLVAYAAILEQRELVPAESLANAERAIERHRESFRHALAAGIPVAMGSDAGTPGNPHGMNWKEVAHMVGQGMAPAAALRAATLEAAQLLGLEDVGAIRSGFIADLLIVEGDPIEGIEALGRVRSVWQAGRAVAGEMGA